MTWIRSLAAVLLLGAALAVPGRTAGAQSFVLVASSAAPATMSRDEVAKIFLKKSSTLLAVDLDKESKVRAAFTKAVLGRSLAAVLSYWQQQIFSGQESPPSEKSSDEAVLAFVRSNPKGIGYVTAGTDLGTGVHTVSVQ